MKLSQVTLCTVGSEKYREQMQKQLDYSSNKIEFGAVKNIVVPTNSIDEWNKFIVFNLTDHIETEFALLVHPDGGVAEPEMWDDEWLNLDYIGAPWPLPTDNYSYRGINKTIHRVGNSVALRSKKLLDLPKQLNMEWRSFHGFYNEDGYIAVNMRHTFEEHGCKFGSYEQALRFGRENPMPEYDGPTFTYHKNFGINIKYPNFEA
jgi:hypothetical protein